MTTTETQEAPVKSLNFIEKQIVEDLAEGKNGGRLQTRFPPEPNGYLHIGHAKAIAMDFGVAEKFGGVCNLRMDDTNPQKEDMEYVRAIERDIQWLGYKWGKVCYASDYFQDLWDFAEWCILTGKAYVDEQTSEEIAAQKGTPTEAGQNSPYRDRPAEESLALFREMNSGNVEPGKMILRAKIDMASPNMHFRDPIMYRVLNMPHWRTGNKWNAYPMYDFTHGQSDYLEGVTHSICTLEFVPHRDLYDLFVTWIKEWRGDEGDIEDNRPRQFEFNKLNLNYTLMSKRNLLILTKEGVVNGWDDPRMPTICGIRRRGYSPQAILKFIDKIGYTTFDALNDIKLMEAACREDLNSRALRVSAVVDPVKLIIDNYPEDKVEYFSVSNNPNDPEAGMREVPFTKEIYIDADDFAEVPPPKFFRMKPDGEVRLMGAYIVRCNEIIKNEDGSIKELHCTADLETGNGMPSDGRKVKGTIHWVSAKYAIDATVRLYDHLFTLENVNDVPEGTNYLDHLNPNSLTELTGCKLEPALGECEAGDKFQFVRMGYFCKDSRNEGVYNQIVGLKDTWSKVNKD